MQFIKQLGSGGFGVCCKYYDPHCDKFYCKKSISVDKIENLSSIIQEGAILSKCNHLNIIKFYENSIENGNYVILMEYAIGGDLSHKLDQQRKILDKHQQQHSFNEIMMIFVQILIGLHYVHQNGIIHKDIKPKNILLQMSDPTTIKNSSSMLMEPGDIIVKIADFGISKKGGDFFSNDIKNTTIDYSSPECLLEKVVTNKTDLWSLGVVLYELVTLKNPKELRKDLDNNFDCIDNFTFKYLLLELLRIDPTKRISAESLIKNSLIQDFIKEHLVDLYHRYNTDISHLVTKDNSDDLLLDYRTLKGIIASVVQDDDLTIDTKYSRSKVMHSESPTLEIGTRDQDNLYIGQDELKELALFIKKGEQFLQESDGVVGKEKPHSTKDSKVYDLEECKNLLLQCVHDDDDNDGEQKQVIGSIESMGQLIEYQRYKKYKHANLDTNYLQVNFNKRNS
ncbi:hypothetical protein CYY_002460 [Polysphondylium violaceum]|uniref:non-specific serine/threonine protein kinase n=1 Tax=Polysphondylium violaceum TaxID=133409 RepID=A0A8J4Q026_9MYCE|nr:hypothetical protein CYY_002460 [Polysphondylium violaceum]